MKVFILTALAFLLGIDNVSTKMFRRPLLIAPIVGIILGNLQAGLIIGATLEVMWMGIGDVGAYMAPDIITGTMISTSLAIMGNTSGNIRQWWQLQLHLLFQHQFWRNNCWS